MFFSLVTLSSLDLGAASPLTAQLQNAADASKAAANWMAQAQMMQKVCVLAAGYRKHYKTYAAIHVAVSV